MDRSDQVSRAGRASPSPPMNCRERLLTRGEVANYLHVSMSWLAKSRMRGDGPPYGKYGRSIRYREADLVQWMKARLRLSTSER